MFTVYPVEYRVYPTSFETRQRSTKTTAQGVINSNRKKTTKRAIGNRPNVVVVEQMVAVCQLEAIMEDASLEVAKGGDDSLNLNQGEHICIR